MMHKAWLLLVVALLMPSALRGDEKANPMDTAPSKFVKSDDIRVHYKTLGEGKTALVSVHGWTADMESWRFQVPAFAGKVRVVLIDLPGHGKSDQPKVEYTMDRFARAINAVLEDAGVESAVLAGHSMGTAVVRQFYRLYPKKTKALVAVDGSLRPFTTKREEIDRFVGAFEGEDFKKNYTQFMERMLTPATPPEAQKLLKEKLPAAPQHVAVSAMRNMFDPALWKDDEIKVPMQAIMARSPFWTEEYIQYVKKLAPDLDYQTMEGVGHFLMLEKPEDFNKRLAGFLEKQGLMKK